MSIIARTFYGDIEVKGLVGADGLTDELMQVIKDAIGNINNGTLTIRQGGAVKGTFSANQASNATIDLESYAGVSIVELDASATSGTLTEDELELLKDLSTLILRDGCYYQKIYSKDNATVYANTSGGDNPRLIAPAIITNRRILVTPTGTWRYLLSTAKSYSNATTSAAGLMSTDDKTKLDGIEEGATANEGTITGIKMNGASKGTSGVVDLGNVALPSDIKNSTITIYVNGTAKGSFTTNQDSNGGIYLSSLFTAINTYNLGSKTASFSLSSLASSYYLGVASGKVTTTSAITISLPTGANYKYVAFWTSPYANSDNTQYSNSISGAVASSTTSRGIATIKASSADTAPFIIFYWQY